MKQVFKRHLYLVMYSWDEAPHYEIFDDPNMEKQCSDTYSYEYVRPVEFTVDKLIEPRDIDKVQFQLKGIKKAQQHLMSEYQANMNNLKATEQSLLAIEG